MAPVEMPPNKPSKACCWAGVRMMSRSIAVPSQLPAIPCARLRLLVRALVRAHSFNRRRKILLRWTWVDSPRLIVGEQRLAVFHYPLQVSAGETFGDTGQPRRINSRER